MKVPPPLAGASLAALSAWCLPGAAAHVPLLARGFGIALRLPQGAGVALTFDDGPHAQGTPAVLAQLAALQARATFFLVGEQVERMPSLAAEITAAGHEIALHGQRHLPLLLRSPRELADDLSRAVATIEDATGRTPSCYRPPYGVFSLAGVLIARRRGWLPLLWSRWGKDWLPREGPASIARRATSGLRVREVVLLHDADHYGSRDSWRATAAALPLIAERLAELGLPPVLVTQST
ncbi:MAG: polysaccharide deacetylase family protein [Gaiellaceae bacterium]